MFRKVLIPLILTALLLAACSPAASAPAADMAEPGMGFAPSSAPAAAPQMEEARAYEGESTNSVNVEGAAVERIVIMNANMSIVVENPAQAVDEIAKMTQEMGGFIVNSNLYQYTTDDGEKVPAASVTVRVPAERLTEARDRIKALVADGNLDVTTDNVSGQDVTREYTDLNSRLKNLEMAQARLQNILDEATKTEDVLAVHQELTRISEEVEVVKGQIKFYDESSRLSAISVDIKSRASVAPLTIGGWQPVGVARDAMQALINFGKFLGNVLIWMVIFCLPSSLVTIVPLFFIIRGIVRYARRRKAAKTAAVTEANAPQS